MSDESDQPRPWLEVTPDREVLRGNRSALQSLREAIEDALQRGEGKVRNISDDLTTVQCLEGDRRQEEPERKFTWTRSAAAAVALSAAAFIGVGVLAVFGALDVWRWLMR